MSNDREEKTAAAAKKGAERAMQKAGHAAPAKLTAQQVRNKVIVERLNELHGDVSPEAAEERTKLADELEKAAGSGAREQREIRKVDPGEVLTVQLHGYEWHWDSMKGRDEVQRMYRVTCAEGEVLIPEVWKLGILVEYPVDRTVVIRHKGLEDHPTKAGQTIHNIVVIPPPPPGRKERLPCLYDCRADRPAPKATTKPERSSGAPGPDDVPF